MNALNETKRDKFVRLAENRTNKAIQTIQSISNLSNRSIYNYTDDDVKAIFSALEREIKSAHARFSNQESTKFKLKK